jgi:ApaG protein
MVIAPTAAVLFTFPWNHWLIWLVELCADSAASADVTAKPMGRAGADAELHNTRNAGVDGERRRGAPRACGRAWSHPWSSGMYRAVTRDIEVVVTPRFVADRSSPENNYFFWAYTISITNNGTETVQLKTRHWRITDAHGRKQEVRGAGVVGEEPTLKAGEVFEYTSGVPLQTPSGFMVGSYGMVSAAGEHFDIEVPAFSLDSVATKRTLN